MAGTATETELPSVPTFEQAAAAALKEHSTPATDATGAEGDEDEHAGEADDTQDGEDGETPADTSGRAAGAEKSGEAEAEGDEAGEETPEGLLTDAEYKALETKHAKDPAALFKALNTAFTTKSQEMAERREHYSKLEEFAPVVEAYEANPKGVLELLAEQNGFTLTPKAAGDKGGDGKGGDVKLGTATETAETRVTAALEKFKTDVVSGLGADLDYLGEPLAAALGPALKNLVAEISKNTVDGEVKPLRDAAERQTAREVELRTDSVLSDFRKAHADLPADFGASAKPSALEAKMTELGEKVLPAKGTTELEHLENLYLLATGQTTVAQLKKDMEAQIAEGVKKALEKMTKGAGSGRRDRDVSEHQVEKRHEGVPTFEEAAEAARNGVRFT